MHDIDNKTAKYLCHKKQMHSLLYIYNMYHIITVHTYLDTLIQYQNWIWTENKYNSE